MKPITRWAGFVDGVIDINGVDGVYGRFYRSKAVARLHYKDVRKVEIREAKPKHKAK